MPPTPSPAKLDPLQTAMAILLTLTAGYVDAIGFLKLDGIYTANMSGNSIAIGLHAALHDWPTVLERVLPVACYAAALVLTRIVIDVARTLQFRRMLAASLGIEILFLLVFMRTADLNAGIVFASAAMGIQAATISRFNGVTVHTAFVTGSLIKMAESFSEWILTWFKSQPGKSRQASKDAAWFTGVWAAYVLGAAAGALLYALAGIDSVGVACVVLTVLSIPDLLHPMKFDTRA